MKPMKCLGSVATILVMFASANAQDVHYNYDRGARFEAYRTYQWVDPAGSGGAATQQALNREIRRAVNEQLQQKGLIEVREGGDLQIAYEAVVDPEKRLSFVGTENMHWSWGSDAVEGETSTISVGMVWIDLYDPVRKRIIWRGDATKTIYLKRNSTTNDKTLQKSMAKMFKNYPPKDQ